MQKHNMDMSIDSATQDELWNESAVLRVTVKVMIL